MSSVQYGSDEIILPQHATDDSAATTASSEGEGIADSANLVKENIGVQTAMKAEKKPEVPKGLVKMCPTCKNTVLAEDIRKGLYSCPKCHSYFRIPSHTRIRMITDPGTFEEWGADLRSADPLEFPGYTEKINAVETKTGLTESVITGKAEICGEPVCIGVCDARFLMGSMGEATGERIAQMVERATEEKLPVVIFTCSGGARMQEGILSLMQMAKTAAAMKRHSDAGLLSITVLTDPTTGGVTASFAMLGDIILAEPGALIGFAGPRVIEQTIGQKLPKGFQSAEFLLEHGFVDRIVERKELKGVLYQLLSMHSDSGKRPSGLDWENTVPDGFAVGAYEKQETDADDEKKQTAWDHVKHSRAKGRPLGQDYIQGLFTEFMELHGDRNFGDDPAIIGGIGRFCGMPVTVIAQAKGHDTKENMQRHFGMPLPEGYRKALRLMKQAEKFHRPVICFVDTPGAFCGTEAEERGEGEAIARNLYEMSSLKTPMISIFVGEGGSGGALALAVADQVWMLENAIYSILSPEGFASILWKDGKRAPEASEAMKLTAGDLHTLGVVERVIPEPDELTVASMRPVLESIQEEIRKYLVSLDGLSGEEICKRRYKRFRGL